MDIYELRTITEKNGKVYNMRAGLFASIDAVYKNLSRVGKLTIVGQNDNSEETVKNGIKNSAIIRVILPSCTDEKTGVFINEGKQDYVVYMNYVHE